MLSPQGTLPLSSHIELYDKLIPEDNLLRRINRLIDFSFVYDELKTKYSLSIGRVALDPILLFKYLLLKIIYPASDVDVVDRSRYDLSYKYFLGLMPEDNVINPSTLTKFRTLRLKDADLLNKLLGKTVNIAIEKGLITTGTVIVDSTHTKSRYNSYSALASLRERSKDLKDILSLYHVDIDIAEILTEETLKSTIERCRKLIEDIKNKETVLSQYPGIKEKLNFLEEGISDSMTRHDVSFDKDAKRGHKSADSSFFGYKTHLIITLERLIAGAVITTGEKGDGAYLPELIEQCKSNGIDVDTVVGDAAYGSKSNIETLEKENIKLVSNINNQIVKERNDGFTFNKDAQMLICPMGHMAERKREVKIKNASSGNGYEYKFNKEQCDICAAKDACHSYQRQKLNGTGIVITNRSETHLKQSEFAKTDEFRNKMKERYKIEAKNAELKNVLHYDKASSFGLQNMEMQGALTLFVCNIKRILKLM